MFRDDRAYFQYRAEVEVERAQEAVLPTVVQAHYKFAEAYFDKIAHLALVADLRSFRAESR
jgi:hypothetical protein